MNQENQTPWQRLKPEAVAVLNDLKEINLQLEVSSLTGD
jgi:hypothetical protein